MSETTVWYKYNFTYPCLISYSTKVLVLYSVYHTWRTSDLLASPLLVQSTGLLVLYYAPISVCIMHTVKARGFVYVVNIPTHTALHVEFHRNPLLT